MKIFVLLVATLLCGLAVAENEVKTEDYQENDVEVEVPFEKLDDEVEVDDPSSSTGHDLLGTWRVSYRDGDKAVYRFQLINGAVHMSVLKCNARGSHTCASQKEVVVTPSTNQKYPDSMQASDVHGGKVTIYIKRTGPNLSLVWLRPGGYQTAGIGKFVPPPGFGIRGAWKVSWADGDKGTYHIQLKDGAVHMSVLSCHASGSHTCASQKEVVVTRSTNGKYPGWMQASDVHGGKVTIYMKKVGSGLSLVWQRPGGYRTVGQGKITEAPGLNILGAWSVAWKDGDKGTYKFQFKNGAVHMSVLSCHASGSHTCASQKEVVVSRSTNEKYPGWMQASDIHGGKVTIYMKLDHSKLYMVWQRPGGYRTTGIATHVSRDDYEEENDEENEGENEEENEEVYDDNENEDYDDNEEYEAVYDE